MDRRELIQFVAGAVAASSLARRRTTVAGATQADDDEIALEKGAVILFQGDSITDAGRDRKKTVEIPNHPRALGVGYPLLIAGQVPVSYTHLTLPTIYSV